MDNYTKKRQDYMERKITHSEYYLWLAGQLGIAWTGDTFLGHDVSWWASKYAKDANLNNVPLARFDAMFGMFRVAAYNAGYKAPSYCDCTCVYKAVIAAKVESK